MTKQEMARFRRRKERFKHLAKIHSLSTIASVYGISRQRVHQILNGKGRK